MICFVFVNIVFAYSFLHLLESIHQFLVERIRIRFTKPSGTLVCIPIADAFNFCLTTRGHTRTLMWTMVNASVSVKADWLLKKKPWWMSVAAWMMGVGATGSNELSVNGLGLTVKFVLGPEEDSAGRPSVKAICCNCSVRDVELRNGHGNDLPANIRRSFEDGVRAFILNDLCDVVNREFKANTDSQLQELQGLEEGEKERSEAVKSNPSLARHLKGAVDGSSKDPMAMVQRPVDDNWYRNNVARRCIWIKTAGRLGDDYKEHQCCAAYMSDSYLMGVAALPFKRREGVKTEPSFFVTSIDHAVWFHTEFRADEWLLYEMESSYCGEGRGFITGRMWTQGGRLAISVAQEGVFRTRKEQPTDSYSARANSKL